MAQDQYSTHPPTIKQHCNIISYHQEGSRTIMLHWLRWPKQYQQAAPCLAVRALTQAVCSPRRQGATPRVSATGGHLAECGLPEISLITMSTMPKKKIIARHWSDEGMLIALSGMQRSRKTACLHTQCTKPVN